MKNFIRSHILFLSLAISLSAVVSYQALEKNNCLKIYLKQGLKIEAGCHPKVEEIPNQLCKTQINLTMTETEEFPFPSAPGGLGARSPQEIN